MRTAYLAADGYEAQLAEELRRYGVTVETHHGRLAVCQGDAVPSVWAANVWYDVGDARIESIGEAAKVLRAEQRNWAPFAPVHRGRVELIADKLPHVSAKPLAGGTAAPTAPLGSFTLLKPDRLLYAARCASPFANGEAAFVEDRDGPPSRAYLKLWEALARLGRFPQRGERCVDLGASPGGWTWSLAATGAEVTAVDKAPLDPRVSALRNVTWQGASAFSLDPVAFGPVDWMCSDVIAYPARLLTLVQRWIAAGTVDTIVCTVKLQGNTDHDATDVFAAIPGGRLWHLHHNRHELTFVWERPAVAEFALMIEEDAER